MFPLYNIVFDIIASVVVCVDFLGTHMASLVLFFKTGVTVLHPPNSTVEHLSIFTSRLTFSFLSRFRALAPFYFLVSLLFF